MRRLSLLLTLAVAGLASTAAPAAPEPVLKISFPEGWSTRQMADRAAEVRLIAIRKRGVTPKLSGAAYARAAAAAKPPVAFRPLQRRPGIEGFLFPETYEFLPASSASSLVSRQIETFEQRWASIDLRAAKARKRTPYDVLVIASMVERETVVPSERRLVAAVIYNRLDLGMPLGIDATLRYGLGIEGTRPLTKAHLASNSPYNTRRFKGLPPTPIGNPGLASIRAAAADPAKVDYLYYVRKPDRKHHFFTADDEEFCAKAREYGYSC